MSEANHWRINITCPRCGYNADVEETFPCGHGPELRALVDACESIANSPAGEHLMLYHRELAEKLRDALKLAAKP